MEDIKGHVLRERNMEKEKFFLNGFLNHNTMGDE